MIQIETGDENSDVFISFVVKTLKKSKHKLKIMLDTELFINEAKVDGYYCQDDREIAISTSDSGWISTLAHEFNHFLQNKNNSMFWKRIDFDEKNAYSLWWDWLNKEIELSETELEYVVRCIQDVEHECESNTIEMIRKYNLPVDMEEYIQIANQYIFFFQYAKKYRSWTEGIGTPDSDRLDHIIPKTKMVDSYYYLPSELEEYFGKKS